MAEVPIDNKANDVASEDMPLLESANDEKLDGSRAVASSSSRSRQVPPEQKELKMLPKEVVANLASLKTPENFELALQGKPIKWKEHNFYEAFHVVRMEQTIGAKKRVEVTLSLKDYQKMPKRTKALYKFGVVAVSYVLVCKECKHPRNPLIVNPEMKRKRPNTRRGTEAPASTSTSPAAASSSSSVPATKPRSKSVGASSESSQRATDETTVISEKEREERRKLRQERREKALEEKKKQEELSQQESASEKTIESEQTVTEKPTDNDKKEEGHEEKVKEIDSITEKKVEEDEKKVVEEKEAKREGGEGEGDKQSKVAEGKKEDAREKQRAEKRTKRPEVQPGRAQEKASSATPRTAAQSSNTELFSKQNNPYEYNSYDVYVEPCSCEKLNWELEFLLRTDISNKVGVSIGMLILNLPTMGVAFALYSDGPMMQSRKMFAFDLLSTHEQNMSIKTVL